MTAGRDSAVEIQRQYYTDTAARYEEMHLHEGCGDPQGMRFVHAILRMIEARSILDVGTATGRGIRDLKTVFPESFVCGVEPVAGLVRQAALRGNTACGPVLRGSGDALPFRDASFDVVCEFSVLHHVADPGAVVKEMLRVANKAVIIADSNRFGQGSRAARLLKLALYKLKLWSFFNFLRTRGKGYLITEGDGLAYSYSVYDSFELIARWADRIIVFPSDANKGNSWLYPLLNCSAVVLCALREPGDASKRGAG